MRLTKAGIIEKILRKRLAATQAAAADFTDLIFEIMKETLARGEGLKLTRFGNFMITKKRERIARNPHTGEAMVIAARRVVGFKASTLLKKDINKV